MKDIKFSGIDWTELAEYWEIPLDDDDDVLLEKVRTKLNTSPYDKKEFQETVKVMRAYLKAFIKADNGYGKPLWRGLAKIRHNESFLKYCIELLPSMWT